MALSIRRYAPFRRPTPLRVVLAASALAVAGGCQSAGKGSGDSSAITSYRNVASLGPVRSPELPRLTAFHGLGFNIQTEIALTRSNGVEQIGHRVQWNDKELQIFSFREFDPKNAAGTLDKMIGAAQKVQSSEGPNCPLPILQLLEVLKALKKGNSPA